MLRPRLKESTGYVLGGGGICMELLTDSGWSPATSIDALVQSVRAMLMAGQERHPIHTRPLASPCELPR